ncbi:MAG: TRAP transporter substrate-binding protein DctP [Leptospiraceae bacterium]|nr:TRAP transporter substrate-binding protein DctP [Leptospiraceae bacterium]
MPVPTKRVMRLGKTLLFLSFFPLNAQVIWKYATLAPEGSSWGLSVKKMQREIESQSKGALKLRVFYGGVAGDEKAMMDKLRRGLLDMASFTGIELGQVVGDVRILELPFFFDNERQIDAVTAELFPDYEKKFAEKGLLLAAWGESGFVYLFSKKPIRTIEDMQGVKIWAPKGDELVKTMLMEFGLVPVYLGFESVLPQLETGGLDAVYAPPMGAIGLQWFRSVRYYSKVRLAVGTGATLINSQRFSSLNAEHQKILLNVVRENSRELINELRRENEKGLQSLEKSGLQMVEVPSSEVRKLREAALRVQEKLAGKLFSRELLEKARKARDKVK